MVFFKTLVKPFLPPSDGIFSAADRRRVSEIPWSRSVAERSRVILRRQCWHLSCQRGESQSAKL